MKKESTVEISPTHEGSVPVLFQDLVAGVDPVEIPVHHVEIRLSGEPECNALDSALHIHIVGIEVCGNASRDPVQPFLDGVSLTMIRLTHPVRDPLFIFADDIKAAVAGAAVDDEVLQIRISLQ